MILDEDGNLTIQRVDDVNTLSDSGADLNQWRVGFEWSWVNGLTVIPIRVGAKNLPQVSAHQREFVDPEDGAITTSFDDQVVGTALTAGVGFVTDAFVFDLSMEYGGWRQEVIRFDSDGTNSNTAIQERDRHIRAIERHGRREWYKLSGFTKRSMVENAVYRYKAIIGPEMRTRTLARQRVEHRIGCEILNKMTALGMPDTYCAG